MKKGNKYVAGVLLLLLSAGSCSKDDSNINAFSYQDDISLGGKTDDEIMSNSAGYLVLDSIQYATAYAHLYRIRNAILNSGKLKYQTLFPWKMRIIRSDTTLNAFCLPGGYIYIYTGIIKFLDNEAEFAGILAHEMAHADLRHTTERLTTVYGIDILLSLILGDNPNKLTEIVAGYAEGLGMLAYSRQNEYEADNYAVQYLYVTEYNAPSLGVFFQKMQNEPKGLTFLSTHPSPEDRIQRIQETFASLGGVPGELFPYRYLQFKNSLP
jgi:Zn-dependent protease with chaperone function